MTRRVGTLVTAVSAFAALLPASAAGMAPSVSTTPLESTPEPAPASASPSIAPATAPATASAAPAVPLQFAGIGLDDEVRTSTINAMAIDDLGFAWFATDVGLARFDGATTDFFDGAANDTLDLPFASVVDVAAAPNGVWASAQGRLFSADPWTPATVDVGVPAERIVGNGAQVWAIDGSHARSVTADDGAGTFDVGEPIDLQIDGPSGVPFAAFGDLLAVGTATGVTLFSADRPARSVVVPSGASVLGSTHNGRLVIGSLSGIWTLGSTPSERPQRVLADLDSTPTAIATSGPLIMASTADGAIVHIDLQHGSSGSVVPDIDDVPDGFPIVLLGIDQQGGTWGRVPGFGLRRASSTQDAAAQSPRISGDSISMLDSTDDTVWGASANGVLVSQSSSGIPTRLRFGQTIEALAVGQQYTWVASQGDLYRLDQRTRSSLRVPLDRRARVSALAMAGERLVVGHADGTIQVLLGARPMMTLAAQDTIVGSINDLLVDGDDIWVGTTNGLALGSLTQGTLEHWAAGDQTLADVTITDIARTADDLWVVSANELTRLDPETGRGRAVGPRSQLPVRFHGIATNSDASLVLVASSHGVIVFEAASAQPHHVYAASNELATNVALAVEVDPSGSIVVGSPTGLARIEPVPTAWADGAQQLYLTHLTVDGTRHIGDVDVGPGQRVTYHFGYVNFDQPASISLRYRLDDDTDDWIEVEPGSRTISFSRLDFGRFDLDAELVTPGGELAQLPSSGPGSVARVTVSRSPLQQPLLWVGLALLSGLAVLLAAHRHTLRARRDAERLEVQVSERTRELALAVETAEAATAAQSRFLAMISHELRTPLASVLGYSQLIAECSDLDQSRQWATTVEASANHLTGMIEELLSSASQGRLEGGHYRETTRFDDLVRAPVEIVSRGRPNLISPILVEIDPLIAAPTRLDVRRVQQVLINLLENATKHGAGKPVTVSIEPTDDEADTPAVTFRVIDHGPGIPSNEVDQIFDPFFRGSNARQRGLGLGLNISSQLVAGLGGELIVEPTAPGSTCFSFTIPVEAVNDAGLPSSSSAVRLLVVDDEPGACEIMVDTLRVDGFQTEPACSVSDAMSRIIEVNPDLIITDHSMPHAVGAELAAPAAEALGRRVPLICVTAIPEEAATFDAYVEVIQKPFRPGDLSSAVRRVLASHQPQEVLDEVH